MQYRFTSFTNSIGSQFRGKNTLLVLALFGHTFAQAQSPMTPPSEAIDPLPVLLDAAKPAALPTVTVRGERDKNYAPTEGSTATKGSAALRDIPQSVNVVPQQLLRDQGARSMQDSLRNVPGIGFSHGDGQRDQVVIRGFTAIADQFIDGVRDDALYFRDLSNIERIEVLKGPSAVLYGRGSSGGLINRVTKKPMFSRTFGEAVVSLGTFSHRRIEADLNTLIGEQAAFRVTLAREDSGSYRDQQFVDRYSVAPSVAVKLGAQTAVLFQYSNAKDQRVTDFGIPALNGKPVPVLNNVYFGSANAKRDDTSTSKVDAFTVVFDHRFNEQLSIRNTSRYLNYELDRYNTLTGGTTDPINLTVGRTRSFILRDESGWFNQTDFVLKSNFLGLKQEWLFGLELGEQSRRSESVSGGTVDRVSILNLGSIVPPSIPATAFLANSAIPNFTDQNILGLYLQNQLTLAPTLKALVGLRFDAFKQTTSWQLVLPTLSRTDKSVSPRVGVVWQPSDISSYYVSFSKSFQPSAEAFALASNNVGNEPEITRNYELGGKFELFNKAMSITSSVFNLVRTNIKNTDPANPALQINVGTQRTNGLELTANGRLPGAWDISASYAFLDGKMVKSIARVNSTQLPIVSIAALGKVPSLTPRQSASIWAMKNVGNGFTVGGGVQYVGDRFTSISNLVTLPAYLTADLAASYKFDRYELAANVKNLTNREHIVSSHGSNDNLILPGPPRELQMTLRVKF